MIDQSAAFVALYALPAAYQLSAEWMSTSDAAAVGGEHGRERLRDGERAEDVGLEQRPHLAEVGVEHRRGCRRAGVVHDDGGVAGERCRRGDGRGIRDVELERHDAVVVPRSRGARGRVDLRGAAFECLVHELGAEAPVRSGDEDDGSVQ